MSDTWKGIILVIFGLWVVTVEIRLAMHSKLHKLAGDIFEDLAKRKQP